MAELSRQLSRAAADKDDAERERQSLLDALRNSEQVCPMNVAVHKVCLTTKTYVYLNQSCVGPRGTCTCSLQCLSRTLKGKRHYGRK